MKTFNTEIVGRGVGSKGRNFVNYDTFEAINAEELMNKINARYENIKYISINDKPIILELTFQITDEFFNSL